MHITELELLGWSSKKGSKRFTPPTQLQMEKLRLRNGTDFLEISSFTFSLVIFFNLSGLQ